MRSDTNKKRFRLKRLSQFSGMGCNVYGIAIGDDEDTLFDDFVSENARSFKEEVLDIIKRLRSIGKQGAAEGFFKHKEGEPGDLVCCLYDRPNSNLRLFCIRYGSGLIVLGGGARKPKNISSWQEVPKLNAIGKFIISVSKQISERLGDKYDSFKYANNHNDFIGDLNFNDDED